MKILLVGSEVSPIIKLGGLGDVMGSLPVALENLGVNQDVIVPYFPIAKTDKKLFKSFDLFVPFDGDICQVEVFKTQLPNSKVDVFMLKNDKYFGIGGINAFANNISETEMFSFFDKSVVEFIKSEFNMYDLIHCNDWHTGLITHLLNDELGNNRPKTLFTIHNLLYQGKADVNVIREVGIIPGMHSLIDWDIADGDVNFMLQGITSSDFVNTVSPTYAKEILDIKHGREISEILESRKDRLVGILNGIDTAQLPRNYNNMTWKEQKSNNKKMLAEELGITMPDSQPLMSFISRLDPYQKGLSLLYEILPTMLEKASIVIIGKGDPAWEGKFKGLEKKFADKLSVNIVFDTELARRVYSSSDYILAPSFYEPCGLIQMIGMWYGALPIAHAVGGLKDSIKHNINGFLFEEYSPEGLEKAVTAATEIYNTSKYTQMVQNALSTDFSWKRSAIEYKKLYEQILSQ